MKHIILVGDSVFDNASYVEEGESVNKQLEIVVGDQVKVTLLAVDGDVTTDVSRRLEFYPANSTHIFVSCGGNDALRVVNILDEKCFSVGDALDKLAEILSKFRADYKNMLALLLQKNPNVVACTVYNSMPMISERAITALALFNEIILQEAIAHQLPIIDLRNICTEDRDYSAISPIEPSRLGSAKIVSVINRVLVNHDFDSSESIIYT